MPSTARESRHIVLGGGGSMSMKTARSMTEPISNLRNELDQGMAIDSSIYVEVLRRCLKEKNLNVNVAKLVYNYINHDAMEQNKYVVNHLVSVYVRCGELEDARRVFDKFVSKNVFSWTIMIRGFAKYNHAEKAMELFNQMCPKGVQPNAFIFSSILKAYTDPSALQCGKEVHAYVRYVGLESDVRMGNALVHMYGKCGSVVDARLVFDQMEDRDVITWTAMIGGLAQHGCGSEAYALLLQMKQKGLEPNAITYVSILNLCSSTGALEWMKEVHEHVLQARLESDLRVGNALVYIYGKCGSLVDARLVFDRMEYRDVITWTVMIGGLAQHGCGHETLEVFKNMIVDGVKPNVISFVAVL